MTDDEKKIEEPEVTQDPLNAPVEKPAAAPPPQATHEKETIHEIRYMEKPEEKKKKSSKLKIIGVLVLILLIGVIAIFATLNVTMYAPVQGQSYPYTTTYNVWFPLGKTVTVGGIDMVALSTQDEMMIAVDGQTQKLVVGEDKLISERRAVVKTLGITVIDTNFQIYLTYRGLSDPQTANFFLAVRTSKQVPQFIVNLLIPKEISAVPA
ncbi:hypothetical protein FTO68_00725 [Methanocalculus taiwanensis]|uniref:DUF1616 domain-containing protein n=1 Tax=Methanocalculus taiwanensis TaxID=106207 RepID=A0ABD4TH35_9EURY|nr:hypothetical protein [Methanocalculus taiwanensis]MCQ1537519.1 hypothetical protein [Methanocalculus taiwanensis]